TRKLKASERITHTLLALNYGAILVLLIGVLLAWAAERTAVVPAFYGAWSILAGFAAMGAVLFGLRDIGAERRSGRLAPGQDRDRAREREAALGEPRKVLVTGATGFIGSRLVEALSAGGHDVIVLARDGARAATLRPPFRLITGLDQLSCDTRIDAIVNLAGE